MMSPEISGHNGIGAKPYNKGVAYEDVVRRYVPQIFPQKIEFPSKNEFSNVNKDFSVRKDFGRQKEVEAHFGKVAGYDERLKQTLENRLNGQGPLEKVGVLTPKKIQNIFTIDEIKEVNRLRSQKEKFKTSVESYTKEEFGRVEKILKTADSKTQGKTFEERAAARLGQFEGVNFIIDCDNTITKTSGSYNPHLIPGSTIAEHMLNADRSNFEEVHVLTWQKALGEEPKLFREGGRLVQLRNGVNNFVEHAKDSGDKITIASANHVGFVKGVRDQIPGGRDIGIRALLSDNVNALAKDAVIKDIALSEKKPKAVIYIGDGASDINVPTSESNKIISLYYAVKGTVFADRLEKMGSRNNSILYEEFKSFDDIIKRQERIMALNQGQYRTAPRRS